MAQDSLSYNRNLRDVEAETWIIGSADYTYADGNHAVGGRIAVKQIEPEKYFHYGISAGLNSDACFSTIASIGPAFKVGNLYILPEALVGLRSVRDSSVYLSPIGDELIYSRPGPKFSVGGGLKIGYKVTKNFSLYVGASYERMFSYQQANIFEDGWTHVSEVSPKNVVSCEIGAAAVIEENYLRSGNNCPEIAIVGGYSSDGAFAGVEVRSSDLLNYRLGHNYGGYTTFFCQSGNAEIGALYNIEFFPWGSDSWFSMGLGVKLGMGMYRGEWSGNAMSEPGRVEAGKIRYAFGGGGAFKMTPINFRVGGVVSFGAFLEVGGRIWLPTKGAGDFIVTYNNVCRYNAIGLEGCVSF